jgi:hypothetical protein
VKGERGNAKARRRKAAKEEVRGGTKRKIAQEKAE